MGHTLLNKAILEGKWGNRAIWSEYSCIPFITFKSMKETLGLILKKKKKIVEGATVVKFQNKMYKLWYFLYFCTPGIKQGVKRSGKLQGTQIFRFEPLFFSQNWTNFEKPPKNGSFWLNFGRFWRFFNSDWKTAAQTLKFEFLEGFHFFWHPAWPHGHESKWWNDSGGKYPCVFRFLGWSLKLARVADTIVR